MSFITVCVDEMTDDIEEKLRYNSLSSRLANLEADDFNKFMKQIEPKSNKTVKVEVDHLAQMHQSKG